MQIAIDGPAGSGKSTVSKIVANKLNFLYLDTGAMYRAIAWACIKGNIDLSGIDITEDFLKAIDIEFRNNKIFLNGIDITTEIRTNAIHNKVSDIATNQIIRQDLVLRQRDIASENDVVMDGRDIGTVVLPYAQLKIFLTASIEARAKRRYDEMLAKGEVISLEDIKVSIQKRDLQDSTRKHSPLKQAKDAILIDTSDMSIDEVVNKILLLVDERR